MWNPSTATGPDHDATAGIIITVVWEQFQDFCCYLFPSYFCSHSFTYEQLLLLILFKSYEFNILDKYFGMIARLCLLVFIIFCLLHISVGFGDWN